MDAEGDALSKLTNCQIEALVAGLRRAWMSARNRGDRKGAARKLVFIEKYESELAQREAAGENPGTEIQESHIGRRAGS